MMWHTKINSKGTVYISNKNTEEDYQDPVMAGRRIL